MVVHSDVRKWPAASRTLQYNPRIKLDHAQCYTAIANDDAQFDGQFFTAVLTTGIYCRPTCRSRTPRAENVRFFATAAAASEAGFRPCLRCRPESAPDCPEWPDLSPFVSRALRMIAAGVLDEMSVEELAHRLHISPRQLRRYFVQELGAPPVAMAQTRRLLFAKKLLDETTLPMAEVALSAGYASIRRFNDALRQTYGRTPTALRQSKRHAPGEGESAEVQLKLFYRLPYGHTMSGARPARRHRMMLSPCDSRECGSVVALRFDAG